jgi:cytoskeleton protein RodZ
MEDSSFGARLRRDREQRGVSLEDLSAATRISVRMLGAFETEQWERLPGGFFNRGFLRSIARHLKVDEAALIAAYAAATNDSHEARAATEAPPSHSNILWISAAVLLLAAALAAGAWLVYGCHSPRTPPPPVAHPASPSATVPATRN